ncbi:hypothetical protein RRG08_036426 [Elysia crispata]|uniref:Uncharacterized protein n=1 Tax=Elysia crispata TaxID=231223 RepID=A0AAE0ZK49_9GAST|nr:hypothetical protein RRG08_036426 [Elysia crispata]
MLSVRLIGGPDKQKITLDRLVLGVFDLAMRPCGDKHNRAYPDILAHGVITPSDHFPTFTTPGELTQGG